MSFVRRFGPTVVLAACAACGGPYANGKALLLGQSDHSGTRVLLMKNGNAVGKALTDASGAYRIRGSVFPGSGGATDLRFEHDGYQPVVQPAVVVEGNDVSVSDVTLRRGARIDPAPILSLQPLGKSKALVQFDHGIDSPSYVVDLVTGSMLRVSGGAVSVRDANDQFATVRIDRLYRLDLTTGKIDPIQPDEGQQGSAAGGSYVYMDTDGKLNALATGALQGFAPDIPFCKDFGGIFVEGELTDAPGWVKVDAFPTCATFFQQQVAINPSLHAATGFYTSIFVRGGTAVLTEDTTPDVFGPTRLRKLDLASGVETTLLENVSSAGALDSNADDAGDFLLVTSNVSPPFFNADYSIVDVRNGVVLDTAVQAGVSRVLLDADFQSRAFLLSSLTGPSVVRFDTHRMTRLCAANTNVTIIPRDEINSSRAAGVVCSDDFGIVAYDWDLDSARTLTTAGVFATFPFVIGHVAFWSEGASMHAARIGAGDPAVTLCATAPSPISALSADGAVAALVCPDPDGTEKFVSVDLRTGRTQRVLAAAAGSGAHIFTTQMAVSFAGRGVALAYGTDASASDPVNCGGPSCTWFFDRHSGAGFGRSDLSLSASFGSSPDDRGFVVTDPTLGASSLVVRFDRPAVPFATVSGVFDQLLGIGADGRFALLARGSTNVVVNTETDAQTQVTDSPTGSVIRLGASSDFAAAEGIVHVDTGAIESLGNNWQPICGGVTGSTLPFFDADRSVLQRYQPGAGLRTIATGVHDAVSTNPLCRGSLLFTGDTPDLGPSTLFSYSATTGVTTPLAADVAPRVVPGNGHLFAFQHPDVASGDLLLVKGDLLAGQALSAAALHARSHRQSPFFEAADRVAFIGGANADDSSLMVARLDGSGARTVGPGADHLAFSLDGSHLSFQVLGLVWMDDPNGPGVALDEVDKVGSVAVSAAGDGLLYSVLSGERRGTYRVDLRSKEGAPAPAPAGKSLPWAFGVNGPLPPPEQSFLVSTR